MARFTLFLLFLLSWITGSVIAATPTSYCKCTCFGNSTIIELGPPDVSSDDLNGGETKRSLLDFRSIFSSRDEEQNIANVKVAGTEATDDDNKGSTGTGSGKGGSNGNRALNCNDCNRKFCLVYFDQTVCKGAKEEDVFTTCFQRDSTKDEIVVFVFIFATSALLVWAVVRPWAEKYIEAARERRSYIPVAENEGR